MPVSPLVNTIYSLREPDLVFEWTFEQVFLETVTLVNCGPLVVQFLDTNSNSDPDPKLFYTDVVRARGEMNTFKLYETIDYAAEGRYDFVYSVYYENYPQVSGQQTLTITIFNPCSSPLSLMPPDGLDGKIITYTISSPGILLDLGRFHVEPDWCSINYSYQLDDPLGELVIASFDKFAPSFRFEYSQDLKPLEENIL